MQLTIRELQKNDIPLFYQSFCSLVMDNFPEYPEALRRFLVNNPRGVSPTSLEYLLKVGAILLIAWCDESIAGLLIADNPYAGVSFCTWVIVAKSYQHHGIGTKLLQQWEVLSKERGAHEVRLETMEKTRNFYKKRGYELLGIDKKGYCGVDKYLFKKNLQEPTLTNMTK